MDAEKLKTPVNKRIKNLQSLMATPPRTPRMIHVPSSPLLERIGYGTGVSVYVMERSPRPGGYYRSPWAVKKVAKRFANKEHQDFSQRLLQEAEILQNLQHSNIIGFRTVTQAIDGTWCLAMEKAEHSLMDLIEEKLEKNSGPFLPHQIHRLGLDVAKALKYLHEDQLLMHGDMKSGNILVFGNFKLAKLCDFGVSLPLESDGKVKSGSYYIGTEAWSAPEVIAQDCTDSSVAITSKADIFSYGLVIWEMLSLSLPHADLLDDESVSEEIDEVYSEALGTRPPLPLLPLNVDYSLAVTIFIGATESNPLQRPSASKAISIWEEFCETITID